MPDTTAFIGFELPSSLKDQAAERAKEEGGIGMSALMRRALSFYLARSVHTCTLVENESIPADGGGQEQENRTC